MDTPNEVLEERVRRLERRVRSLHRVAALSTAATALLLLLGATTSTRTASVLRARGLVIEDAHGHERILLGAPVPQVSGRKRHDPATALIFLGEDGADRLAVGYQPDPQSEGKVVQRIAPAVGLQINDPAGNERTGYGYLENGRVVLGLDYPNGREALIAIVEDREAYSALMLKGETEGPERAGIYVGRDGPSVVKVSGTSGMERLMMYVPADSAAKLLVVDPDGNTVRDVLPRLQR